MLIKIITALILSTALFGVELSNIPDTKTQDIKADVQEKSAKVFGYNLFNGSFSKNSQHRYNPNYLISIGDTVNIKMWGAFEYAATVTVDSQGNIFVPNVGTVNLLGVRNDNLSQIIQDTVKKVFKKNVYAYADLANYQPISIFVTGAVNKPGLYEGLSSDSVIQFIDKAKGINAQSGSYRKIKILRQNKEIKKVDLYEFLLSGSLELFQFHTGDVVVVDTVENYVEISGDVKRPYRYEMLKDKVALSEILHAVLPNPTLTNFTVTKYNNKNQQNIKIYSIKDNLDKMIYAGESIKFIPDNIAQDIEISISGEHSNTHNLVVKKGTSLKKILETIKFSELSAADSFQIFRKSVAMQQKKLIDAQLNDLEAKIMTTGSMTTEEALIRKQEAALLSNFIERARKVEPKGLVIINKDTNLSQILLEDGDEIFIPKKSHMVIVQGEVMLPGAQTYVDTMSFEDYIASCGGYSFRANEDNVLIIQKNGKVINHDSSSFSDKSYAIQPGDSILVLGKVDSKFFQVVKDITQIVYQLAVGAAVVINAF